MFSSERTLLLSKQSGQNFTTTHSFGMKRIFTLVAFSFLIFNAPLGAQIPTGCNKLGAWLWYIDITGFSTHAQIADTLAALGAKRIYVKVADGQPNPNVWPELLDTTLTAAYKARGLEVWGWSYNYTNNPTGQANALYLAAKTGYQGFVVDVETEFDGLTTPLSNLFSAFSAKKQQAIAEGWADSTFQLYCTTWGNPADHDFHIELIDPHVDGFMPQTYVEQWGPTYVQNLAYWIEVGNDEYASLGATKPLHHIVALEEGEITAAQINAFVQASGPETSIWRIPGGGVPTSFWQIWNQVNWRADFCEVSSTGELAENQALEISPNPVSDFATVQTNGLGGLLEAFDASGRLLFAVKIPQGETAHSLDWSARAPGFYWLKFSTPEGSFWGKMVKAIR
jgi:hypothetical protein